MTVPLASSFRDPAGFVYRAPEGLRRAVMPAGREDYDLFMSSLYGELAGKGWIVPHDEVPRPDARFYKVLAPSTVPVVTYPFEWCFSQLRDAAELTLRIQLAALARGMMLKDATPYNVLFDGTRPVFIDTLSFERIRERPWRAYRQFCENFLGPLALMAYAAPDLNRFLAVDADGIPLEQCSRLLPPLSLLRPGLLLHVHLHAQAQRRFAAAPAAPAGAARVPRGRLEALAESLLSAVRSLRPARPRTVWGSYYSTQTHYSAEAERFKEGAVRAAVARAKPRIVLDLGGNNGRYSRCATEAGALAVCADMDAACVEDNYVSSRARGDTRMLPVRLDLASPWPALGWRNAEREAFVRRVRPDLTLGLALVHHLRVGLNVTFGMIADLFADFGAPALVEFVPKDDPMTRELLRTRDDIFDDYTREEFERAFGSRFSVEDRMPVPGTGRLLYTLRPAAGA